MVPLLLLLLLNCCSCCCLALRNWCDKVAGAHYGCLFLRWAPEHRQHNDCDLLLLFLSIKQEGPVVHVYDEIHCLNVL